MDTEDTHRFDTFKIGTNIESLYLLVATLQGSDAGQQIFKISGIFNFDVPL